jgi:hypothetical protein
MRCSSTIPRQLALSPMRVFASRIEHAFDVTISARGLLWSPQFSGEKFGYFRQPQWIGYIAIDATEFAATGFHQHKMHWLVALWTGRRRESFGHGILSQSAGV